MTGLFLTQVFWRAFDKGVPAAENRLSSFLEVAETMKLRNRFATMSRVVRLRQKQRADAQAPGPNPGKRLRVPWESKKD